MTNRLRCAIHESGHACAAVRLWLPLREVVINDNGSGITRYSRRLSTGTPKPG